MVSLIGLLRLNNLTSLRIPDKLSKHPASTVSNPETDKLVRSDW